MRHSIVETSRLKMHHELGGRIGFHLSLRAPDRVRGHLAVNALHPYCSARRLIPKAWRAWWTPFVETPVVGRTVLGRWPAFSRMLFRLGNPSAEARTTACAEDFIARLREPARARAAERVQTRFAYLELLPTLLGRYRSVRLTVPTLILNGTADFAHFLPEERSQLVGETALRFFGGLAS